MASLVADYGESSGSDSDSDHKPQSTVINSAAETAVVGNLLEAAVDDDSDSDEQETTGGGQKQTNPSSTSSSTSSSTKLPNPLASSSKLPPAALAFVDKNAGSVFSTSFHKAEEAKASILQQHVKLTTTELPPEVAGKKICWNFRKGKCRFGSKCKYYHGNEIVTPKTDVNVNSEEQRQNYSHSQQQQQQQQQQWAGEVVADVPDEDDYLSNAKRKKRAGVGDNLVPPKRAMRQLDRMREQERPWTVHK